jgi:hypothetical protein
MDDFMENKIPDARREIRYKSDPASAHLRVLLLESRKASRVEPIGIRQEVRVRVTLETTLKSTIDENL